MLPLLSQSVVPTSAEPLVMRAAAGAQATDIGLQNTVYFGYWFSHWRA